MKLVLGATTISDFPPHSVCSLWSTPEGGFYVSSITVVSDELELLEVQNLTIAGRYVRIQSRLTPEANTVLFGKQLIKAGDRIEVEIKNPTDKHLRAEVFCTGRSLFE